LLFIFVQSIKKADRQNAIRFFIELLAKELKERLQHVTNVYQRSAKELHVCISETNKNSQAGDIDMQGNLTHLYHFTSLASNTGPSTAAKTWKKPED